VKVRIHFLRGRVQDDVRSCKACRVLSDSGDTFLCGWHENLVAADRVVADLLGGDR
jgi:hypothetical protein